MVSSATRELVLSAVKKTGYVLDEAASNFRKQRTGSIVALLPNIANPYYSAILAGIADGLADTGYNLLVVDTNYGRRKGASALQYFNSRKADGVIVLLGSLAADTLRTALDQPGVPPVVQVGEWPEAPVTPRVTIRNVEAAKLAIRHLTDLGHRDIGFISGPRGNFTTEARLQGVAEALGDAGLSLKYEWVFDGDFSLSAGKVAAARWLALKTRPTAMFCDSDEIACGFIGDLLRAGIRVPGQVSVVGFDDIEIVEHIHPALTTIRQPRRKIGGEVAAMLLRLLDDPGYTSDDLVVDVELIVRDSTSPPEDAG